MQSLLQSQVNSQRRFNIGGGDCLQSPLVEFHSRKLKVRSFHPWLVKWDVSFEHDNKKLQTVSTVLARSHRSGRLLDIFGKKEIIEVNQEQANSHTEVKLKEGERKHQTIPAKTQSRKCQTLTVKTCVQVLIPPWNSPKGHKSISTSQFHFILRAAVNIKNKEPPSILSGAPWTRMGYKCPEDWKRKLNRVHLIYDEHVL